MGSQKTQFFPPTSQEPNEESGPKTCMERDPRAPRIRPIQKKTHWIKWNRNKVQQTHVLSFPLAILQHRRHVQYSGTTTNRSISIIPTMPRSHGPPEKEYTIKKGQSQEEKKFLTFDNIEIIFAPLCSGGSPEREYHISNRFGNKNSHSPLEPEGAGPNKTWPI